ncbi:unnamed protein product [Gadus morhua 'NCC']
MKMGRKDASATKLQVEQYRKQIGKQDNKKTKSVLKATQLKADAKRSAFGIRVRVTFSLFVSFHLSHSPLPRYCNSIYRYGSCSLPGLCLTLSRLVGLPASSMFSAFSSCLLVLCMDGTACLSD